jgi:purine-binding chemotaxis protein CheW
VREVLEYTTITKVPKSARFMRGVINVRGHAVPVIDLRTQFGLRHAEKTVDTCIIIVELELQGEAATIGVLVDGVQEVLEMSQENIEEAPRLGSSIDSRFIQGIGKMGDSFVILLNIQEIFSQEELGTLSESSDRSMHAVEQSA